MRVFLSVLFLLISTTSVAIDSRSSISIGPRAGVHVGAAGGAEVSMSVGRNIQIAGVYLGSQLDASEEVGNQSDAIRAREAMMSTRLTLIGARYYPFNGSFNVGVWGGQRRIDIDLDVESVPANAYVDLTSQIQSNVAAWTIGNVWRWKHFYLGADWIGQNIPISSKVTSSTESGGVIENELADFNEEAHNELKRVGETNSTMALVLSLGTGF